MYAGLREFVDALSAAGELRRVSAPADPILEIASAADQASKRPAPRLPHASTRDLDPRFHHLGGPALLFENVHGSDIPVLINAFGSYRRVEMALGCEAGGISRVAARIAELVKPEPPSGLADAFAKLRTFLPLLRTPPKRQRGSGPCQQVVIKGDAVDLTRLPFIRCWPHDGDFAALGYRADINDHVPGLGRGDEWNARYRGRYITLGGIHTIHASDRDHPRPPSHNIGMYRVQLLGPRRMAMHWHVHHDGARHWRSWKALGRPMPVAVALGGESVLPYAATAPLPPGISELLMAGFLNGRGIPLVRAKTVPLWVPANAEIVIEGYVSHEAGEIGWPRAGTALQSRDELGPGAVFEGPFGDHTGFYSLPDRYPIFDVTAITMRRDPIYPTTVVGLPPQEDYFLGKATERIFLPLLKTLIHDIDDYDLPIFGAFHNCAALKIDKAYPLQGRRVMHSVWGAGQMAWTKNLFVVGAGVDVHDTRAVLRAAADHCHPVRDTETVNGPLDILDHAAPRLGAGMKIGFDCTPKVAGEEVSGIAVDAPSRRADPGWSPTLDAGAPAAWQWAHHEGWLVVKIDKQRAGDGARAIERLRAALERAPGPPPPFIIVLAGEVDAADLDQAFFHWCAHTDASRDLHRFVTASGHHVLAFDATPKVAGDERQGQPVRPWPPILTMPADVAARASAFLGA